MTGAPPPTRAVDRARADRIYYTLAALIGAVVIVYFAVVPLVGANLAFHFYLMLWITMASGFNVTSGFSGYMPFGYVAFYGMGAFTTAILVKKVGFPVLAALPSSAWRSRRSAASSSPTCRRRSPEAALACSSATRPSRCCRSTS
jgi:branched-chain amino acid transport system permease protein